MLTSCEPHMPFFATPLPEKLYPMQTPNQRIFIDCRKRRQKRESQPAQTPVYARKCLKGGLCERREEFNEVRGEHWSDLCSANAYVNASLKSLLGAHN